MSGSSGSGRAPPPSRWLLGVVTGILIVVWGTTWGAVRISLEGYPPLFGVSIRFALASLLLLVVARARGVDMRPDRLRVGLWATQAVCAFGVSYGLVYWAEQWVPSGLVAVLFSTMPIWVTLFSYPFLPVERLDRLGLLGALLGFGGVAVIFSDDLAALGGAQVRFASAVVLIAPVTAGIAQVVIKRWGQGQHPLTLTAPPMAASAVGMGLLSWWLEAERTVTMAPRPTLAVLYLAFFGSALTFTLYFWMLQHVGAIRVSLITYGTPVVAIALGTLFLDEPITPRVILGALLVLGGVSFVVTPRRRGRGSR